ncbi:MAG: PaaI family thioesterase [Candidatus Lokiarchaeota archaeon]|nr:PaaI family thioesterase [Candidatus Lokiarchaeota archaeon]
MENKARIDDLLQQGYSEMLRDFPLPASEHVCIGCSPTNPISLKMRFYCKPGDPEVVTRHVVGDLYCGFPAYAHGGIIALMFDEILAYASYQVHQQFGMTKSLSVQFYKPVAAGKVHFLRARVVDSKERASKGYDVSIEASLHEGTDASARPSAAATGVYVVLPVEQLRGNISKRD